ncbi:MAG: hypothetical protein ACT4QB_15980 [Gammaproteobacteria bacterium]
MPRSPSITIFDRAVLVHCRAGFEREAAEEIGSQAADRGIRGATEAWPGLALFTPDPPVALARLAAALRYADLVFARQLLFSSVSCTGLAVGDRVAPLVAAARDQADRYGDGPQEPPIIFLAPAISFSWARELLAFSPSSRRKATLERQPFSVAWVS